MRIGLKLAILQSGQSQRAIAAQTHIAEARLSTIVRGWVEPTATERVALQHRLGVGVDAFGSEANEQRTRR